MKINYTFRFTIFCFVNCEMSMLMISLFQKQPHFRLGYPSLLFCLGEFVFTPRIPIFVLEFLMRFLYAYLWTVEHSPSDFMCIDSLNNRYLLLVINQEMFKE